MDFLLVCVAFIEINNVFSMFGKFAMWDRVKSTRANLMVKVKVEELRDIPASVVIWEGDDFQFESHTVTVVILEQNILGLEAPDEDSIHPFGNPHPMPQHAHFHPNQHTHFLGPIQQHENGEPPDERVQDPQLDLQLGFSQDGNANMDLDEEDE